MEQWEIEKNKAAEKRLLLRKFPDLGKIVSRRGRSKKEYGVVVMSSKGDQPVIRYDNTKEHDSEELIGLPFEEEPNYTLKYINQDGTRK